VTASNDFAGHDPFDALRGTRIPQWVRKSPRARQIVIQLRKRTPVDLSAVLGIAPFTLAKAVACFVIAAARTKSLGLDADVAGLVGVLDGCEGNLGGGAWGYEFDVQTRWAYYPAGSPNLIATVFCGRALLTAGVVLERDDLIERGIDAARYLMREHLSDAPYFTYTRDSERLVHNANVLGASLVVMAGRLGGDADLVVAGSSAAATTVDAQSAEGTWPYGDESLSWTDSFHTAYVLDSLLSLSLVTGEAGVSAALERGIAAWRDRFFGSGGEPYYFVDQRGPFDIHTAGTAVDVASRLALGGHDCAHLANDVDAWTRRNLVGPDGIRTYYRRHALFTDKRHFVRWGDAHWALGASSHGLLSAGARDPLELSLERA